MSKAKAESSELSYTSAISELKKIVDAIERGEIEIDALQTNLERANFLVSYCQQKLRTLEGALTKEL